MSLWPFTSQVVCIAMLNAETLRGQVLYVAEDFEDVGDKGPPAAPDATKAGAGGVEFMPCADEAELLTAFWDVAKHYDSVVTFNGRGFDVPFIYLRSALLNVAISKKNIGTASTVLFTAGAAMYAGMFLLPLYYQQLHGETVLHAGLLLIPQGVGSLAARFAVGKLVARLGARLVTMASFLIAAVATVPFAFAGPHTSLWLLGAVLVIRGFGIGTVLVPPMSVAYQDVPRAGIPHATMNTRIAQQVGASFGIAIVAVALQSLLAQGATSAFQGAFWWATGITVAALIPALALPAARAAGGG